MERQKTTLVVDASIVVKWFVPEQNSDLALKLRDAHVDGSVGLIAPDLVAYEVANALRYRADLSEKDYEKCIRSLFDFNIIMLAPSSRSIIDGSKLAKRSDLTIYDAAYYEIARNLDCSLITADEQFFKKVAMPKKEKDADTRVVLLKDYFESDDRINFSHQKTGPDAD